MGILLFYVGAILSAFVYPAVLVVQFRGVAESALSDVSMRYSEKASTFMLGSGFAITGWYVYCLLGLFTGQFSSKGTANLLDLCHVAMLGRNRTFGITRRVGQQIPVI